MIVPAANPDHWTRHPQDAFMRRSLLSAVHFEVRMNRGMGTAEWKARFRELVEKDHDIRRGASFRA